jgi:Na+/H+ antiporter NhaD/arsenite permease-like protein
VKTGCFLQGIIIIAANAGGAWTPIGDVTTTMLWIGGQDHCLGDHEEAVLALHGQFAGALGCYQPRCWATRPVEAPPRLDENMLPDTTAFERNLMFYLGLGVLVAVPVFKSITHLPPFMGILFGLGMLWMVGDLVHRKQEDDLKKQRLTMARALTRIDMSSIVFFIWHFVVQWRCWSTHTFCRHWPSGWTRRWAGKTSSCSSSGW